jgi:4'-phosphopantetheinyl transferase
MPEAIPKSVNRIRHLLEAVEVQSLGKSEIHVWQISLAQDAEAENQLKRCLSPEERERAARLHSPQDCRRFVIRRAVLRHLLGGYTGSGPEAVCLSQSTHGKPFLEPRENPDALAFSCSHSADLALIALARGREVGVDIEFHRPLPEADELLGACFSPLEIAELAKAPEALKQKIFFDCWTRKEAFVKAIGLGLSYPLDRFSVSSSPDQPAALLRVEDDPQAVERWSIQSLEVHPHFSAALAFEGKNANVKCFEQGARCLTNALRDAKGK